MTTVGVFSTHAQARKAIEELRSFGVVSSDISYLYTNVEGNIIDDASAAKVGEGTATGAAVGAMLGALAGFVVAEGILPGLGGLIVAGPLAAALGLTGAAAVAVTGAATGLAAGGLIGALTNLGITNEDSAIYQDFIKKGDVLIISHSAMNAREVFVTAGAKQIGTYS